MSMQDKMWAPPGGSSGSELRRLSRDEVFLRTAWNSVVYTVVAVGIKFLIGSHALISTRSAASITSSAPCSSCRGRFPW